MSRTWVTRVAILCLTVLLIAACTDEIARPTMEQRTVDELESAVIQAAQALADHQGIEGVRLGYSDDQLQTTAWMDYRSNGDYRTVFFVTRPETEGVETIGAVRVGDRRYQTIFEPEDYGTWSFVGEIPEVVGEPLPIGIDLDQMIDGTIFTALREQDGNVTRQATAEGEAVWRWTVESEDIKLSWEWEIDSNGVLRALTTQAEPTALTPDRERFELTPLDDPEPITPPEEGSQLDLDALGVPDDLLVPSG